MNAKSYLKRIAIRKPDGTVSNLYDEVRKSTNDELKDQTAKLLDGLKERIRKTEDHKALLSAYAAVLAMAMPKNAVINLKGEEPSESD